MNVLTTPSTTMTLAAAVLTRIAEAEHSFDIDLQAAAKPLLDLSQITSRGRLDGWAIVPTPRNSKTDSLVTVLGNLIRTPKGMTSPVAAYDPDSHRILTHSCTVYQLGLPDARFAATNRHLLRAMGFAVASA